ncbi:hypothetical protein ACP70R_031907 [Stipagrostis hirtigluma subsp. patula]
MEQEARQSKKLRGDAYSGLSALALRLAQQLAGGAGDGDGVGENLVFSPLSVYAALALVAAGARGATLSEVLDLLGVASRDELAEFARGVAERTLADRSGSGGPLVAFACAVWHDKTVALKPAYRTAAMESYKADTRAADFKNKAEEAIEEINNWVSKSTNDLIASILPPGSVHSMTSLALANAIYFKGRWSEPFAKECTEDRPFYRLDGSHVRAPFMNSRKDQFVRQCDGFKVLKLPYQMQHPSSRKIHGRQRRVDGRQGSDDCKNSDQQGSQFSMCIVLPDTRDGLPDLVGTMANSPSFLWGHLPVRRVKVGDFRVPRFKLCFSGEISGVLKAMGLETAFDAAEAGLSDMLEGSLPLVVKKVFHKAVIEVNEEGTEAVAATAVTIVRRCRSLSKPVDFVADHPFAFFVVEEVSGAIVFMGHVLDPTRSI